MSELVGIDRPILASPGADLIKQGESKFSTTYSRNPMKRRFCLPELDMGEGSREQGFRLNGCR